MLGKMLIRKLPFRYFGDTFTVKMSALSPTMSKGTITEWLVKEGDEVEVESELAIIETDKAKVTLQSAEAGFIAKVVKMEGSSDIPIGETIAYIVEEKDDVSGFVVPSSSHSEQKSEQKIEISTVSEETQVDERLSLEDIGDRLFISPKAKMLSHENSIDIKTSKIVGTGPSGRIISENVASHLDSLKTNASTTPSQSWHKLAMDYKEIQPSSTRKVIAERLTQSKREIPHFYLESVISMNELFDFKREIFEKSGVKLSVNDFLIKAVALSCQSIPETRSQWHSGVIREFEGSDICFAVDSPTGLITPKVTNAHSKSLTVINSEIKELVDKARSGTLKSEEFTGGVFTISNLGNYGVDSFSAVINPPQSCILAIGTTSEVPRKSSNGELEWRKEMKVCLSCDHRVVDGAVGSKWLSEFKKYIETPLLMTL